MICVLVHVYLHQLISHELLYSLPPFHGSSDIDGVLRRANATEYGLASGVFTRDINKARTTIIILHKCMYH